MKSKTQRPLVMYRLFVKIKHLPLLSTVNLPFVEFIHISQFGTVYTLGYRCFRISSSWTKLHTGLVCLKQIFLKFDFLENFINKCFKRFMDTIHVVKETTLTVKKKPFLLVLPYVGSMYP